MAAPESCPGIDASEGCTCAAGLPHGAGRNPAWASSRHHVSWPGTVHAGIKGHLLFLSASAVYSRRGTAQSLTGGTDQVCISNHSAWLILLSPEDQALCWV